MARRALPAQWLVFRLEARAFHVYVAQVFVTEMAIALLAAAAFLLDAPYLDATQGPVSFVRQVLDRLPERVPAFGKTIGFVINYSPDQAVRFDRNGQPIAILDKAVRPGTAVLLRLGGRPIPAEVLRLAFDK
jgi:hypothetical protein